MPRLRVRLDGPLTGAVNMETDAGLLAAHHPGDDPILRLYRWSPPAVSIGYNQSLSDFDQSAVRQHGFDMVQRPTGGRAILHAEELTYAVIGSSPSPRFGSSLNECYQTINRALLAFLNGLGIAAEVSCGESRAAARSRVCFKSAGRYEIRVGGRKVIGSAQRRTGGVFLQHGSILTGPRHVDLLDCLENRTNDGLTTQRLLDATTDLGRLLGRSIGAKDYQLFCNGLVKAFCEELGLPADIEETN